MKVQAALGAKCPKEGKPREYITDNTPVEVPDSAYYIRLVADGSLIESPTTAENADKKGGKK